MIQHISRSVPFSELDLGVAAGELGDLRYQLPDRHDVVTTISTSFPGVGRCDSCGRIIVRGVGRWWERWVRQ